MVPQIDVEFICNRIRELDNSANDEGIVPVRQFEPKERYWSFVSDWMDEGIVETNEFAVRYSVWRPLSPRVAVGMEPLRELNDTSSNARAEALEGTTSGPTS